MADGSPPAPAPAPIRRAPVPDDVWTAVRDDYLAGVPAPEACRRHGVGLTALRDRAAREGWRRADQPWVAPALLDPDDEGQMLEDSVDGEVEQIAPGDMLAVMRRRMLRAALRGDAAGALRWRRVCAALNADGAEIEARFWKARECAIVKAAFAGILGPDPDGPDGPDGVFGDRRPESS